MACLGLGALVTFAVSSSTTPQHLAVTALAAVLLGLCGPRGYRTEGSLAVWTGSADAAVTSGPANTTSAE